MATRTVRQSGGDFSTLAAALSDAGTGAGDVISIEGTWTVDDTSAATVQDDNITIQTDVDSYHNGVYDESNNHYRLVVSGDHCLTISNGGSIIDGVAIVQDGSGSSDEGIRVDPVDNTTTTIERCIVRCSSSVNDQDCIYVYDFSSVLSTGATLNLENNIIYGGGRAGLDVQWFSTNDGTTQTVNINSCTFWDNNKEGDASSGGGIVSFFAPSTSNNTHTFNIFNTISLTVGGGECYEAQDGGTSNSATFDIHDSIDSDGSITNRDSGAVGALETRTATDNGSPGAGDFVIFNDLTTTPFDLTLQDNATDNDAQDAHSNTSGAGLNLPTLDIEDETRDTASGNVDIGADAFPAAAPADRRIIFIS